MRRKLSTRLTSLFVTPRRRPKQNAICGRLHLQVLEERLALAVLPAGFTETLITTDPDAADQLSSPTAMEFSPTGELWVVEQLGNVKLVRGDGSIHTAHHVTVNSPGGSERGLLGIAFDPSYDGTGPNVDYIYLYYTSPSSGGGDLPNNRLTRFTVTGAGTAAPSLGGEVIVRDLPANTEDNNDNHNGGAIHFGPDGKLYVAVGDHNYDGVTQGGHVSQIPTTPFGKILRLNADGTNPDDNPFHTGSASDWQGSIWALGLRNPYTFSFDPDSGAMFINDVGETQWEEINEGERGVNYGWAGSGTPLWEGFENPPPPFATDYRDPAMAYDHSNFDGAPAGVAITGGAFYPSNGSFGSNYAGLYFFADFAANFIRIFDPDNPGESVVPNVTAGDEDTSLGFATGAANPVDLKVDAAGNLYYLARGGGGDVFRISFTGNYGPTSVVGRQIFYNESAFDGGAAAADALDDAAIAGGKSAYLPGGGTITSASITSYSHGINGIMVDLAGNHGPIDVDDFRFRVGTNNTPSTWAAAPNPAEILVRAGAGAGGADRVEIIWANGTITNTYLQVIVEGNDAAGGFNTSTGLAASNVFFFGNRVGDTFNDGAAAVFATSAADEIAARGAIGPGSTVTNLFDFDRNGAVNANDQIIARGNVGFTSKISITSPPAAPTVSEATADDDSSRSGVASALAIRRAATDAAGPASPEPGDPPQPRDASPLVALGRQTADESASLASSAFDDVNLLSTVDELADELLDALLADLVRK